MKKLSGFSLMEMMVVLLIVSIVAAASAPMINKRMVIAASEKSSSPWVRVDANRIAYNLGGSQQTASVGTSLPPAEADTPRFYIDGTGNIPQLALGQNKSRILKLLAGDSSVHLSDNVDSDHFSSSKAQTVIGYQARTSKDTANSVAIGYGATVIGNNSTAVGVNTSTQGQNSVALGCNTKTGTNAQRAVVIGSDLNIAAPNSVSIGSGSAIGTNSIAIGGGWDNSFVKRTGASSLNSIAIGVGANAYAVNLSGSTTYSAEKIGNNLAIGSNVTTLAQDSLVIGANSKLRAYGTNSILIGYNNLSMPKAYSQIGIGSDIDIGSYTEGTSTGEGSSNTVAIGHNLRPSRDSAIAIGSNITAGASSIAIGTANSDSRIQTGSFSTAIGWGASAESANSTAIGKLARTTASNQVVLGSANDTVFIPGNLVVAGNTVLGINGASHVWLNASDGDGNPSNGIVKVGSTNDNLRRADGRGSNREVTKDGIGITYDQAVKLFSDRRLKNVGKVFEGGLAEIKKLEVFNYTFKSDSSKTPRVGVMAQDLQKIFPNAVTKGEDGFLRIRMEDMFYALVNAVKENDSRITALEKENIELKKQNVEFQKRLAELEKKVK